MDISNCLKSNFRLTMRDVIGYTEVIASNQMIDFIHNIIDTCITYAVKLLCTRRGFLRFIPAGYQLWPYLVHNIVLQYNGMERASVSA